MYDYLQMKHGTLMEKLKDPEMADIFEAVIRGTFSALNILEDNINFTQ